MRRISSTMFAIAVLLAAPTALTSCQEDAPEINYTINITVVNDFTKVVEAINNGSLKNEEAIKALTDAIDKMSADQTTKLQAIIDVLNSVDATLEAKLAAVEAALKAQTLSLETKLDLLEKAIQSQTLSLESKLDLLDKAIKAQTTALEGKMDLLDKAIKALTNSIDKMNEDQAAKLQALTDALTSVGSSLETKLALIEAAVKAQTLSLEEKLDLLRQAIEALPDYTERLAAIETAIKGLPDYTERLAAIETAIKSLPDYTEKLDAIKAAIEALPDYSEKFDAVTAALDSLSQNLNKAEKDLAEKVAGVSSNIKDLVDSVDSGNENAASALEKIIAALEELKTYIGDMNKKEEYVDLGLSVKWAARNLGADRPSDHGYYFAWGETEPKVDFSWKSYKWMTPGQSSLQYVTKYTYDDQRPGAIWYNDKGEFIGDGKTKLDSEDDAATAALGILWRMPTPEEFVELFSECAYEYAEQDGVGGMIVVGRNGNSIFLPEVAPFGFTVDVLGGSFYWTSSLDYYGECEVSMASSPGFKIVERQDKTKYPSVNYGRRMARFIGLPVRPVRP